MHQGTAHQLVKRHDVGSELLQRLPARAGLQIDDGAVYGDEVCFEPVQMVDL
ncbi:hypothetical protein [Streptomyces alkaliphilus]|uniref:hypothetical protein n=1 Tax=Streptomyces alkaliphilus TaxID=1472722 RepID=UPI0015FE40C6|nr:hypothetical protein [Streptomyces alkaliphilus]